jgi:hypothetical protein
MHEPPGEDGRGENQQSECLVAPESAQLLFAARALGLLLGKRLDAGFNHGCVPAIFYQPESARLPRNEVPPQYRRMRFFPFPRLTSHPLVADYLLGLR